jgi:hypothetical protein
MSWQARLRVELYAHRASVHDPAIEPRRGCDAPTKRVVASVIADAASELGAPLRGIGRREIATRAGLTLDAVARAIAYLIHDDGLVFVVKPGGPARPAWYGIDLERCPKDLADCPQARVPGKIEGSELVYVSEDRDARPWEDQGAIFPGKIDYYLYEERRAGAGASPDDDGAGDGEDDLEAARPVVDLQELLVEAMGADCYDRLHRPARPRASAADHDWATGRDR